MADGAWALQRAVYQALSGDATLTDLLGGAQIYDDVPREATFPYVTFGPNATRDWSTGTESGQEHILTLNAWSRAGGRREVLQILMTIENALDDANLTVDGHRLVNLRHEVSETNRDADGEIYRGVSRFRAVTETLSG